MELVWSIAIPDMDFVHYNYQCKPFVHSQQFYYAFHSIDRDLTSSNGYYGDKITVIVVNLMDGTSTIKHISFTDKELKHKKILISKSWHFVYLDQTLYLYVGFLLDVSKPGITIADMAYQPDEFTVKTDYEFADKYLKYNQRSTIACFDKASHKQLWKQSIRGFIYTDIEENNNCLMFGTAGKGGAFYCIQLDTGHVLTEHINTDASNYSWQGSSVILRDKKGNLEQIDPFTGAVVQTLLLKDKLFYAPILAHEQFIYTTAYHKPTNSGRLICVNTDEH